MHSEEWHDRRLKGIGGSDASAILGMNPYKTNVELYEEKTTGVKQIVKNVDILERGHIVEPFLRGLFIVDFPEYEVTHGKNDYKIHEEFEFIRGELDGDLTEIKTGKKGVLEIKHVEIMNAQQRLNWKDKIPDHYFIQILHYLLITNYEFAILKARLKSVFNDEINIQVRHYCIERSGVLDDIEYLKEKEIDFWNNYVIPRKKPALILPPI